MSVTLEHDDEAALRTPFLRSLVARIRAEDTHGAWERRSDASLLRDFVVTKEERRAIPMIGDPDPDTLARVKQFWQAVGLAVEREAGVIATPMMEMSHEGFGRVVLLAGRLVLVSKSLRDVHRFGFEDLPRLAAEGAKFVSQAAGVANEHPELARA
jgi:probable nitrogen fixation protein